MGKRQRAPQGSAPRKAANVAAIGKSSKAHAVNDHSLRQHLVKLLESEGAHVDFNAAIADLPADMRGVKASGVPFTAWQLLEHLRIAQSDILEFSRNAKHESPKWPEGYWPEADTPSTDVAWEASVQAFRRDLKAMEDLVSDPSTDLFARIPHGSGQTILREALLIADHNAYHVGQLVLLRRALGTWKG